MNELKDISILIAEDDPDLRELMVDSLQYAGALVVGVENGSLALQVLKDKKIDVLISDVRMPGGDGIELLRNIAITNIPRPRIFLHTGFSDLSAVEAKTLGVIKTFHKPVNLEILVNEIQVYFKDLS